MSNLRSISSSVNPSVEDSPPPSSIIMGGGNLTPNISTCNNLDTLHFGLYVLWPDNIKLFDILDDKRYEARGNGFKNVPLSIEGIATQFNVYPQGKKGGYAYHIENGDLHLFFSVRKPDHTPNVFIEIGSVSLWTLGATELIKRIHKFIEHFGGIVRGSTVNRVDLCADFIGFDIEYLPFDFRHWICRGNKGTFNFEHLRYTGVNYGSKKSPLLLKIYDKVCELREKKDTVKQVVFAERWGQDNYDDNAVTRVEFLIRRDKLKDFKIRTLEDLAQKLASLWSYCTQEWCRVSNHVVNRNNTEKAEIHPFWKFVQSINWQGIKDLSR